MVFAVLAREARRRSDHATIVQVSSAHTNWADTRDTPATYRPASGSDRHVARGQFDLLPGG
ncbi:hypothetical protein [Dactylosporangium sp. CA-233914]|uniref:hypothetical protein n=1 Tax=Dactylosporangium sp. CA-233914 TaxID=3239934 RepID=UPI003D8D8D3E